MIALLFLQPSLHPHVNFSIPFKSLDKFLSENSDALIIDVSPISFEKISSGHRNKINIPLAHFDAHVKELYRYKSKKIVLYGDYKSQCLHRLRQEGFENIILLQ